jgi:hypothetical protein
MVYGLNVQPEWGFGPKVDWEGQDEYPARAIPALNPVNDGGTSGDSYLGGIPVDGTNFPKWVKWSDPNGNPVPDFDGGPFLNVSEKAKAVIESLEPGVHQFFPVEYEDHKGNSFGTRYWFVVCNRLDSVDRDHTNMALRKGWEWTAPKTFLRRGEPLPEHLDPSKPAKPVFNLKAIGDKHFWVDKHISSSVWLSDRGAELLQSEGLTGIRLNEGIMESVQ